MNYERMLRNLNRSVKSSSRRYSLAEIISESYKVMYDCEKDSRLQKVAEAHIQDVKNNPTDLDRLSRQLCNLREAVRLVESKEVDEFDLLVPEEKYSKVEPEDEEIKESVHDEDVEEKEDEDLLEGDLTEEELEALTQHLKDLRKNRKSAEESDDIKSVDECDNNKPVEESTKGRSLKRRVTENNSDSESKTYESLDLSDFAAKSNSKAFMKTFKKLDQKLKEGTALTRQESISLYKAANSALTQLSVELEHNPEFLSTFKECVSLLSADVDKLLCSLKEGKAPSKATMKSLAKFSESLKKESDPETKEEIKKKIAELEAKLDYAEDHNNPGEATKLSQEIDSLNEEEDPEEEIESEDPAEEVDNEEATAEEESGEGEDPEESTEESEEFDQEYADARVELHKELADEHADSEDPEVKEKLAQDAEEVINLPGTTEEQAAEIKGEEVSTEEEIEDEETDDSDDSEITDDELSELKKHLTEMRKARSIKESKGRRLKRRDSK